MPDLLPVYERLEGLLGQHSSGLLVSHDFADANAASTVSRTTTAEPGFTATRGPETVLLGAPSQRYPNGECFAAVKLGKRYVSYYLMGLYRDPGLAEGLSDALLKRKQGKSCFNFSRVDDDLFAELDALTARCHAFYDTDGLLRPD